MPPGSPDRFGRAEIHVGMTPDLTQNRMEVTVQPHEILLLGPGQACIRVVVTGTRTRSAAARALRSTSALFLLREQEQQGRKIHRQIWTVKG